jgi:hypothetical protein
MHHESSFAAYLDLLKPGIPEELISNRAFSDIRDLAAGVPGALAFSTFGFECPLTDGTARADFLFSLRKDNAGPEILAGRLPEHDFDEKLRTGTEWSRLCAFGDYWADSPSPSARGMDDVWLEFDISSPSELSARVPGLFMAPFIRIPDSEQAAMAGKEPLELLETVFCHVRGRKPSDAALDNWRKAMSILPLPRHLFQMGIMVGRSDSDTLRLCLLARNHEVTGRYLSHMDWPGDFSLLAPVLEQLSGIFEMLYLHVDAGTETGSKIGIECKFPGRRGPSREPRWFAFLDLLTGMGLCHPAKKRGLLQFPGHAKTPVNASPGPLRTLAQRLFPLYRSYFVRTLYHVKLVFDENRFSEAKAYLGIDHAWKGVSGELLEGRGKWGIIG